METPTIPNVSLFVNQNFDETKLTVDSHVVILKTECQREDLVQIYAENLVNYDDENKLQSMEKSKEVPNVYFATYKQPLNMQAIQQRVIKFPKIAKR